MAKYKETAVISRQEQIGADIFSMCLKTDKIAKEAKAGQFVAVYCKDGSRLLPRPISICEINGDELRLVYRIAGKGTEEFSKMEAGTELELVGPLGNGFPKTEGKALVIGGGIGIPPMLQLAKELTGEKSIVAGYRDFLFLDDELSKYGSVYVATDDGSAGTKGTVIDAIKANQLQADVIYACGPMPMLKAVKAYAEEQKIPAWISLEEHMACGVGACLGCVVKTKHKDEHTHVNNTRICLEGPVFNSEEVEI